MEVHARGGSPWTDHGLTRAPAVVDPAPRTPADTGAVPVPTRPAPVPSPLRAPGSATSLRRLSQSWSVVLGVGWPLVVLASLALEPTPADPDAPVPLVIAVASLGALAAVLATSVAAGLRHPAAAVTSVVSGLLLATFVVACPVSGHHEIGLWGYAELALVVGMLGVSLAALGERATEVGSARR